MSISRQEEIIAGIWLIAGLLAFIAGINWLGWALCGKATADTLCCFWFAWQEIKKEEADKVTA